MHLSCNVNDAYVCTMFLQVSDRRMRWCVQVNASLVHDVVQKDMFCREQNFLDWFTFFEWSVHHLFLVSLAIFWLVWPSFIIPCTCSMWNSQAHSANFTCSLCARCFVGPGFKPLISQHDLFVGSRFDSLARPPVSGPWNPGLCYSPPQMEQQVALQIKTLSGVKKILHDWWPLLYGEVEGNLLMWLMSKVHEG